MKRKRPPKPAKAQGPHRAGACPTPGKVHYRDRDTAQRFAGPTGRVYRCPTGDHWHVSTRPRA